jgi:predicted DNA-binding WGR domain protein
MRNAVQMTNTPTIYLERRDASRNMARFYALEIETDLFGAVCAVRRWGRIGSHGRQLSITCNSIAEAEDDVKGRAAVKRRRGYRDC